jgi:Methyltransferase domain
VGGDSRRWRQQRSRRRSPTDRDRHDRRPLKGGRTTDRLADTPELLDGSLDDEAALIGNLRDLRRVNRWLFGSRLSVRAVARLVRREPERSGSIRILDVGTGAADIPLALLDAARRRTIRTEVMAVDSRPEVLAAAASLDRRIAETPGLSLGVADGRSLPFGDRTFDVGHASLVVHHLEPRDAVGFLVELARVSRTGVVVNDLLRSRVALAGAVALATVATRNRLTRHDGPLSVRRAYSEPELVDLLAHAGLRPVARLRDPFRHRIAIAARLVEA